MSKYAKAMKTSMVVRIEMKWNISQEITLHIHVSIHYLSKPASALNTCLEQGAIPFSFDGEPG